MALNKQIRTKRGVDALYWRIEEVGIVVPAKASGSTDPGYQSMHVEVAGYASKAERNNGVSPLELRMYDWQNGDCPNLNGNLRQQAYNKIKTLPEFTGSTDDNNE